MLYTPFQTVSPIRQQLLDGIYLEESQIMIPGTPVPGQRLYELMAFSVEQAKGYNFPPIPVAFDVPLKNVRLPYLGDFWDTAERYANLFGHHAVLNGKSVIFRPLEFGDTIELFGTPREIIATLERSLPTVYFESVPEDDTLFFYEYTVIAPLDAAVYLTIQTTSGEVACSKEI